LGIDLLIGHHDTPPIPKLGKTYKVFEHLFNLGREELCWEMMNTSMLNLAEERRKVLIKKVNDKANTQYIEIFPWKPKPGK
jgi:hypothetical protein